jgi:hypothetical protein
MTTTTAERHAIASLQVARQIRNAHTVDERTDIGRSACLRDADGRQPSGLHAPGSGGDQRDEPVRRDSTERLILR